MITQIIRAAAGFLAGSAAIATAACVSEEASAQDSGYVIDAPDIVSMGSRWI